MAGEAKAKVSQSFTAGGITVGGTQLTIDNGDFQIGFQKTLPAGANVEVDVTVDVSTILGFGIEASQDCDVYTNLPSTGSFVDHLVLKKNELLFWKSTNTNAFFLTADVTKFYVTTTQDTVLKFAYAADSTPVLA